MKKDRVYIEHALACIDRISQYCAGGKQEFIASDLIQDAVIRNLQVLAESTQRISQERKLQHDKIQWRAIAGFRNVLVHDYLGIDADRIWKVIEHDLPTLKENLEQNEAESSQGPLKRVPRNR